jgi:Cu2+-exporting ATPase
MSADSADGCTLCGLPTAESPVTAEDVEGDFCCRGCLSVARSVEDPAAAAPPDPEDAGDAMADAAATAFLRVDGMHCATCEAFLESRASDCEGVRAADASYAAGLLRVGFDPDAVDREALPTLVSGAGYHARAVDAPEPEESGSGRLLVGGFFGMMVMVWYVLFLYPVYLGVPAESLLLDVTGSAGRYLLANVWVMATVVVGYTGYPLFRGAYVSLRAGQPNMDLLVALAAGTAHVYSTAVLLGGGTDVYFDVAVAIVVVVSAGDAYTERVRERAADRLGDLAADRVDSARRRTGAGLEELPVEAVAGGDELVVRAGERVPVDGTVVEGEAAVDESLVTGESLPVRVDPGDSVVGGAVVADGQLVVAADAEPTSTLDRLVSVLWEVQAAGTGAQRLADRLAGVFVPVAVAVAVAAAGVHLLGGAATGEALLAGLAVLVVSCPCALGLATPLAVAGGVREALDRGVVLADETAVERAPDVEVVVLDKTGTLTTGEMAVLDVAGDPATAERAAAVEQFADHPIAAAITDYAAPPDAPVEDVDRYPGRGVAGTVGGERVVVGHPDLFAERDWPVPAVLADRVASAREAGRAPALVGWDGRARGVVVAGDEPRDGWQAVVGSLAADREVVVLTGDGEAAAGRFREHPGVSSVLAEVPPEGKAEAVARLGEDRTVAMVGDGSNDAPALGAADLGVAMGGGAALAADAADAVVTTDDLRAVPTIFEVTAATNRRVRQNLGWAFLYNAVAVPLAATGLLNPLFAAAAMVTSSLLVVGNSARSLGVGDSPGEAESPAGDT